MTHPTLPTATAGKPACPFCKSADVTTTSRVVTPSTYWRCVACGQIWNPTRLLPEWKRRGWVR